MQTKTFLFAVLDWGLGHATRSAVVIDQLLQLNYKVIIASSGNALTYLASRFPNLAYYELSNYELKYSANKKYWKLQLFAQSIQLLRQYQKDQQILKMILSKNSIDALISDNRPSIFHKQIPSVYITHQLQLPKGFGSRLANFIHQKCYARYQQVWVPDVKSLPNLAGNLSLSTKADLPVYYLGMLSSYQPKKIAKKYQYTAILSGPEPQRSILEQKIVKLFKQLSGTKLIVRGTTKPTKNTRQIPVETSFINLASNETLQSILAQSELVICRSGYTSLMDLTLSKTKALLIPTPGQPEQEYLATYMRKNNWFSVVAQDEISAQIIKETRSKQLQSPALESFQKKQLIKLLDLLFSK